MALPGSGTGKRLSPLEIQIRRNCDELKILILSTPKTGNTWLMSLLAAIYDLPKLGLVCPFDRDQASKMGPRWIAFHHFLPDAELVDWIREERPFVLTTVRHPGDVLVSLYHHLRGFTQDAVDLGAMRDMLHQPFERREIYPPARHTFREELDCSIAWKRTGLTRVVRYEDLRRRTRSVLLELTAWLGAVPEERIAQAMERCDIGLMRGLAGKHSGFFRSGEAGGWRAVLSAEMLEDFAREPYRSQFEELGYGLDADAAIEAEASEPAAMWNPFRTVQVFENGVRAAPIAVDLYLSLDGATRARWPAIASTGPGSYFAWLQEAPENDGHGRYEAIRISHLLHYVRRTRPDLEQLFRDLAGSDRAAYAEWLMRYAESEFGIDAIFLEGLRKSYLEWGLARCKEDPWLVADGSKDGVGSKSGAYASIRMSNLLYYFHQTRPHLAQRFPDLAGSDRAEFAEWLIRYVERGHQMDPVFLKELWSSYVAWGSARCQEDRERRPWWPKLTNYALHVYRLSPRLREAFPDVFGRDRWDFLQWMVRADNELYPVPEVVAGIRENLRRVGTIRGVLDWVGRKY